MSAGSRQEVMIRSLIEALAVSLQAKLRGQPRQKAKLEDLARIMATIETLWERFPLALSRKERAAVVDFLDRFRELENEDLDLQKPEVLIVLAFDLGTRIRKLVKDPGKARILEELQEELTSLYDTFDRKRAKAQAQAAGGDLADRIFAWRI